jgi:hypothetical protein
MRLGCAGPNKSLHRLNYDKPRVIYFMCGGYCTSGFRLLSTPMRVPRLDLILARERLEVRNDCTASSAMAEPNF